MQRFGYCSAGNLKSNFRSNQMGTWLMTSLRSLTERPQGTQCASLRPAMREFQTSATLVGGRNLHGELVAPTGRSARGGHAKDGVYGMDLPAVDLEGLEGDERAARAILLGVSEVEIQQD